MNLLEKVIVDIVNDSIKTDPERIQKSKKVQSTFNLIDQWGILHFTTTSETTSNIYKQELYYPSIYNFKEQYKNNRNITQEQFQDLLFNQDIKITCDDKSFLYYAWAHKASQNNYRYPSRPRPTYQEQHSTSSEEPVNTSYPYSKIFKHLHNYKTNS